MEWIFEFFIEIFVRIFLYGIGYYTLKILTFGLLTDGVRKDSFLNEMIFILVGLGVLLGIGYLITIW